MISSTVFLSLHQQYAEIHQEAIKRYLELKSSVQQQQKNTKIIQSCDDLFATFPRLKNPEIWIRILCFVGLPFIAHFAQVCRFCFYISETDRVWRILYQQHFGEVCNEESSNSWKQQQCNSDNSQSTSLESLRNNMSVKMRFRRRKFGIVKEGPLWLKERGLITGTWTQVWCVLTFNKFFVMKEQHDTKPQSVAEINSNTNIICHMAALSRKYPFSIKCETFEMRLGADDDQTRNEWVKALHTSISKVKEQKRRNSADKNDNNN